MTSNDIILLERDKDILKTKYPALLHRRLKVLYKYDRMFKFHRTKLAAFLKANGLQGYGRVWLAGLMGKPPLKSRDLRAAERLVKMGLLDEVKLELFLGKNIYRRVNEAILASYGHPYRSDRVEGLS